MISMKRLFILVIAIVLTLTHLPFEKKDQNAQAASSKVMDISVSSLNVKSSPSSKAKTFTNISKNHALLFLTKNGSWREVEFGRTVGWLLNNQISDTEVINPYKTVAINYGITAQKDGSKPITYKKVIKSGVKGTNKLAKQTSYKNGKATSQKVVVGTQVHDSYNWDKNKIYVYQNSSTKELYTYEFDGMMDGWENWNIHNSDFPNADPFTFKTKETSRGLYMSDLESSNPTEKTSTEIAYPIKLGSHWQMYTEQFIQNTGIGQMKSSITGVNQAVTTPNRTFKNCIIITDTDNKGHGDIRYYAPNVGYIRIDYKLPNDKSTVQLVQLKSKHNSVKKKA